MSKIKVTEFFGNPTPIGLVGLAIGCMVLAPIEFGWTKGTDPQAWRWMMLTAGVLQIYAGIVDLINKNILGATAFTLYGVLWVCNSWITSSGQGAVTDPHVKAFVYVVYLLLSVFLLIGFMSVSMNLTIILIEFNLIFIANVLALFIHDLHRPAAIIIGILLILVAIQTMWAAAGGVLNSILGKNLFQQGKAPLTKKSDGKKPDNFESIKKHDDLREKIVHVLYEFWEKNGFEYTPTTLVTEKLNKTKEELIPDFAYLYYKGYAAMDEEKFKLNPEAPKMVRLTAEGLDYYSEMQMKKFNF